jgi:hypothetical protein
MTQMPDGAQLSPDGHYWLETGTNEWRPVPGGAADTAAAPAAAPADPRLQARLDAGIAPERHAATDEQRAAYIGESTVGHESLQYTVLEVPEIGQEHEGREHDTQEGEIA